MGERKLISALARSRSDRGVPLGTQVHSDSKQNWRSGAFGFQIHRKENPTLLQASFKNRETLLTTLLHRCSPFLS